MVSASGRDCGRPWDMKAARCPGAAAGATRECRRTGDDDDAIAEQHTRMCGWKLQHASLRCRQARAACRLTVSKPHAKAAPMTRVRAAVFRGDGTVELRELPAPAPPAGGAVLAVEAVGLCGTDLAQFHGELHLPGARFPIVPGHE